MVYRLITCASVEEKIYRRQVFKGGLMRAGTQAGDPTRYFSYVVRHRSPFPPPPTPLRAAFLRLSVKGAAPRQVDTGAQGLWDYFHCFAISVSRVFSVSQELRDLFVLKAEEVARSATQADLAARHSARRVSPPGLDAHLAAVADLPNFVGAPVNRTPIMFTDGSGDKA